MPQTVRDRLRDKYRATGPTPEETTMPMTAIEESPIEATPGIQDGDIPDPPVPAGALAPLPADQFQDVKDDMRSFMKAQELTWAALEKRLSTLSMSEASALQHLCDALAGLKEGVTVSGEPYAASIEARTPAGYAVRLVIKHQNGAKFFEALGRMEVWLTESNYSVVSL